MSIFKESPKNHKICQIAARRSVEERITTIDTALTSVNSALPTESCASANFVIAFVLICYLSIHAGGRHLHIPFLWVMESFNLAQNDIYI